jgi:hypothetical protein
MESHINCQDVFCTERYDWKLDIIEGAPRMPRATKSFDYVRPGFLLFRLEFSFSTDEPPHKRPCEGFGRIRSVRHAALLLVNFDQVRHLGIVRRFVDQNLEDQGKVFEAAEETGPHKLIVEENLNGVVQWKLDERRAHPACTGCIAPLVNTECS